MKVVQVNGWTGRLLYPLLHFIQQEDPDIVCMQEVLSSGASNPLFDLFSMHQLFEQEFAYSFFSPTFSFDAFGAEIELGNAIFSKHPITNEQTVFTNGEYQKGQQNTEFKRNIRNIQTCTITVNGSAITVANHHGFHDLDPLGTEQSIQCMQTVIDHLNTLQQPLILCGDLNVAPHSKPIQLLEASLPLRNLVKEANAASTLSSAFRVPGIKVVADYIFTSSEITNAQVSVPDVTVSDHKPVMATVSL